jgi:hypothetical protein
LSYPLPALWVSALAWGKPSLVVLLPILVPLDGCPVQLPRGIMLSMSVLGRVLADTARTQKIFMCHESSEHQLFIV